MRKASDHLDLAYEMFSGAENRGLMYHTTEDEAMNGRTVQVNGQSWINFASCSYLGLETDERLKQGAIDAVMRYGTQFSSSRSMLSVTPYGELEGLLEQVFGQPVIITPTTSLGHISALPILVQDDDAIILDQQVHHSVQAATKIVSTQGTRVELIRHNRLDMLEEAIQTLRGKVRRIWYMADGLYSMFGDFPPVEGIKQLLQRYEQLHLYVDDAHCMSWCGTNGKGFILEQFQGHERLFAATSLNKSFASAGGAFIIPDGRLRHKIRAVGGPMVFSGPIQPACLGASIASARIHLSDEIYLLQGELQARIRLCNRLMIERGLPLIDRSEAPVRFLGLGLPRVAYNLAERLLADGFFVNVALFPAVPMKRSGIRFTLTRHQTLDDIRRFVDAIAHHLPLALDEEGSSLEEVWKAFDLLPPLSELPVRTPPTQGLELRVRAADPELTLQHETTIQALDPSEWDQCLGTRGTFTWEGLKLLETAFQGNGRREDNWRFHYYVVRDAEGAPILATFLTEGLWKDDMIAPEHASRKVEERRLRSRDPYFLTSLNLAMGSLLTEGDHLFLDRSKDWRRALKLLLKELEHKQEMAGATSLILRDFAADDAELDGFLADQGFAKFSMPESLVVDLDWQTEEEFLASLSHSDRRHHRNAVRPWNEAYIAEVLQPESRPDFGHLHQLYRNVKARSLLLNTFDLPEHLFEQMLRHPGWEIVVLRLKPEFGGNAGDPPHGYIAAYVGPEQYVPLVAGMNYDYVRSHGLYRQLLRLAIRRAQGHGKKRVLFGMGAALEKQRFGARVEPRCVYIQSKDHYQMEVLAQMMDVT